MLELQDVDASWAEAPTNSQLPVATDRGETTEASRLLEPEGRVGSTPREPHIDPVLELGFVSTCFRRRPIEPVLDTPALDRALGHDLVEYDKPGSSYLGCHPPQGGGPFPSGL